MSNETLKQSGWNGPYGWNQTMKSSDRSSEDESPTKSKANVLNASSNSAAARRKSRGGSSGRDSDSDKTKGRKRRSRSPRHKDRRRRSRSGSRHRRRHRSGSRSRRRRSRSNSRRRSRSKSSDHNQSSQAEGSKRSEGGRRLSARSRSKDRSHRRRSRSRGRRSSSRSRRDRPKRSRSRDRRRRRSRSKSRDRRRRRSRSRSKRRPASRSPSPYRFGGNQAMDAQERLARRLERAKQLTKLKKEEEQQRANGFLGLKDDKLKEAIERAAKDIAGSGSSVTIPNEMSAMSARATAQMNALRKQAEQETGISVPSYYNPLVVNPMMFAQQQAKRNLLWSKKDSEASESTSKAQPAAAVAWTKPALGDEKTDEKFAKLMGIKQIEQMKNSAPEDELKKRNELFSNLDQQYEQSRVITHTQRGAGLGFASSNPNTLLAQQANQQLNPAMSLPPKS